jgi:hypothetical protein
LLSRPIESDWPYLWIDSAYVKVRESERIVPMAVIIAVGVSSHPAQVDVMLRKVARFRRYACIMFFTTIAGLPAATEELC